MVISDEDFYRAIQIANDVGKRGKEISLIYIPPTSATEMNGQFIVDEYTLSASGQRER